MNQDQIKQLNEAVEAVKTRKIENVYFVACGGSKAIFDPAQFIFDRETTLPSFVYNANEFIHRCPKGLGEKQAADDVSIYSCEFGGELLCRGSCSNEVVEEYHVLACEEVGEGDWSAVVVH